MSPHLSFLKDHVQANVIEAVGKVGHHGYPQVKVLITSVLTAWRPAKAWPMEIRALQERHSAENSEHEHSWQCRANGRKPEVLKGRAISRRVKDMFLRFPLSYSIRSNYKTQ